MEKPKQIFRKSALERLSSPEQLDQAMRVTTPKGWAALCAFGALILVALAWSLLGTVPTKVNGRGILIKEGGVFMATARDKGNVVRVLAHVGDPVQSGQILCEVEQPELTLRIEQARVRLDGLAEEEERLEVFHRDEREEEKLVVDQQRTTYQTMIEDYSQQVAWLEERVATQEQMRERGLLTLAQVLDTRNRLYAVQHEKAAALIQLKQLNIGELTARERRRQQLREKRDAILVARGELDYLDKLRELNTAIRSPFDGHVLEVMVKEGQRIDAGSPILNLQRSDRNLEARIFLNPADGEQVRPGMRVDISPDQVRKEEYGFIIGTVFSVSEFPITRRGMLALLENDTLVDEFSRGGAPIEVRAELRRGSTTPSGFEWSSGTGPPLQITSGTMCGGAITIATNRPIRLIIPALKRASGL